MVTNVRTCKNFNVVPLIMLNNHGARIFDILSMSKPCLHHDVEQDWGCYNYILLPNLLSTIIS